MGLNHQQYNTHYLLNARDNGEPINDAEPYSVRIVQAQVAEGETYWKVIGIHHLLPRENFSNHHVYLEALDEDGQRPNNPPAFVGWTWQGRHADEPANPVPLDKGDSEAGGNITMHFGQVVSVWVQGIGPNAQDKSDLVENLHTAHADEPLPDGSLLNTIGHHSFYVVFQRTRSTTSANGAITGRVERGQGQTVRLLRNNQVVGEQLLTENAAFSFEKLFFGLYQIDIVNTGVGQGNIRLDPTHSTAMINLALPLPTESLIFGTVQNGQNKMLLLVKEGNIIARVPLPLSGQYRFENLGSGNYSVVVFETNVRQDNIGLDGTNSREVNLVVPTGASIQAQIKAVNHYLLFGPPDTRGRQTNLLLATDFILAFSVTVGFSLDEAKMARRVTVVGEGIGQADLQALRDAGSQVEIISGDAYEIEAKLNERVRIGRAFGG